MDEMRSRFYLKIEESNSKKRQNAVILTQDKYDQIVQELKSFDAAAPKTPRYYALRKRYQLLTVDGKDSLIRPTTSKEARLIHHVALPDVFDKLQAAHDVTGHGGRNRMHDHIKSRYDSISLEHILVYLQLCKTCQEKAANKQRGIVVKPMVYEEYLMRAQVDLIDMQSAPDGEYRFILNYQELMTKYVILRPLKRKTAEAVATELVDIFCMFGAPAVLQCDNGREFRNQHLLDTVAKLWPGLKIIHGKPRHSQSQGSVERANRDVENMLMAATKAAGHNRWASELKFVQFRKNCSLHSALKQEPYQAMFGVKPRFGLQSTNLPDEIIDAVETEDQLNAIIAQDEEANEGDAQLEADEEDLPEDGESDSEESNAIGLMEQIDPSLSQRSEVISSKRKLAVDGLQQQARKMLRSSDKRLPPVAVGDTVRVPVPSVDKGRIDSHNVLARIESIDENSGTYKLGTTTGTLNRLYTRGEFTPCAERFIEPEQVDPQPRSLRTVASQQSTSGGQGFLRCDCKTSCSTKRCKCKAAKVKCNSRCHNSSSCKNKHDD